MEDMEKIIRELAYPKRDLGDISDDDINREGEEDEVADEGYYEPKQFFTLHFTVKGQIVIAARNYNEAVRDALECIDDGVAGLHDQENIIISKKFVTEKEI